MLVLTFFSFLSVFLSVYFFTFFYSFSFLSVYRVYDFHNNNNIADADLHYERQVKNRLAQKAGDSSCAISANINDVQRCADKMKTKKSSWS